MCLFSSSDNVSLWLKKKKKKKGVGIGEALCLFSGDKVNKDPVWGRGVRSWAKAAIASCVMTSFCCRVTGCQMWSQRGESLLQRDTDYYESTLRLMPEAALPSMPLRFSSSTVWQKQACQEYRLSKWISAPSYALPSQTTKLLKKRAESFNFMLVVANTHTRTHTHTFKLLTSLC